MAEKRRVVITGMGIIAPNAVGLSEFEDALRNAKSGLRKIPEMEELNFSCQVGGVPSHARVEAKTKEYFSDEDLLGMNRGMVYTGIAAIEAYQDAGLKNPPYDLEEVNWDTGAIIGTGLGSIDVISETIIPQVDAGKIKRMGSSIIEKTMCSAISAKMAGLFALGNNVSTNSSACTTGTEAIIYASQRIQWGLADRMFAGSSELYSPYLWAGFDSMRVLNRKHNENPHQASRPMSQSASGFIPASGSGVLFLESLDSAQKRNARIYAEVIGSGLNCGGQRMSGSMTAPNPTGVQRNIRTALEMAEIQGEQIDYINGHLTSTFADPMEVNNWREALAVPPNKLPFINSTKSLIGHGLGAAGSMEAIATILQLHKGFLHKSLNCEDLHERIQPYAASILTQGKEKIDLKIAMKASFGFGDVNGSLIFKKWE